MTLHISEAEVRALLTMRMAVDAVEEISRKQASSEVVVHPRSALSFPAQIFSTTWLRQTTPPAISP
jgi:ornithine cyclodeaminase/alanine dehydrogenase-like protein (mu-crystallin family)